MALGTPRCRGPLLKTEVAVTGHRAVRQKGTHGDNEQREREPAMNGIAPE
jgi:hypothetical protein